MSWGTNEALTAVKLNSENYIPSYSFSHSSRGTSMPSGYTFYLHDCGGSDNPVIIDYYSKTSTSKYWGNSFGPDLKATIQKLDANGNVLKTVTICNYENKNITYDKNYTKSDIINMFGTFEGWYRIDGFYERDDRGSGTQQWKIYAYPITSRALKPLRYYTGPTSSGYTKDVQISVEALNGHHIGTY